MGTLFCLPQDRESGDGFGSLTEEPPLSLRYGDHSLSDGDRWNDMIHQAGSGLGHTAAVA